MNDSKDSYVIAFSGIAGSGKTRLVKEFAKLVGDATVLLWDDYGHLLKFNVNPITWMEEGFDFNEWKMEKFDEDVISLKKGGVIEHPITKQKITSAKHIVLEEPTGRTRTSIKDNIDFLVYIDLPFEISLARFFQRELNDTGRWADKEKMVSFLQDYTAKYLAMYHLLYKAVDKQIKPDADLVVNGYLPADMLANEILSAIRKQHQE